MLKTHIENIINTLYTKNKYIIKHILVFILNYSHNNNILGGIMGREREGERRGAGALNSYLTGVSKA